MEWTAAYVPLLPGVMTAQLKTCVLGYPLVPNILDLSLVLLFCSLSLEDEYCDAHNHKQVDHRERTLAAHWINNITLYRTTNLLFVQTKATANSKQLQINQLAITAEPCISDMWYYTGSIPQRTYDGTYVGTPVSQPLPPGKSLGRPHKSHPYRQICKIRWAKTSALKTGPVYWYLARYWDAGLVWLWLLCARANFVCVEWVLWYRSGKWRW